MISVSVGVIHSLSHCFSHTHSLSIYFSLSIYIDICIYFSLPTWHKECVILRLNDETSLVLEAGEVGQCRRQLHEDVRRQLTNHPGK